MKLYVTVPLNVALFYKPHMYSSGTCPFLNESIYKDSKSTFLKILPIS